MRERVVQSYHKNQNGCTNNICHRNIYLDLRSTIFIKISQSCGNKKLKKSDIKLLTLGKMGV